MNIATFPMLLSPLMVHASMAHLSPDTSVRAYNITKPPVIDGVVDDAVEWKDVPSFSGMVDSVTNQASPEQSRFWLAYDKQFVYFAAKLTDAQLSSIRANEYRTNVDFAGDDFVELDLNLSGSSTDQNVFRLNPRGATFLGLAGGRAAKREWAGEFLSKARVTSTGWEVEARIPWQIMQLPKSGKRNIRFNANRFISRLQRTYQYAYTGSGQYSNYPLWSDVETPKQSLDKSIKLLPYVYAGYDPKQKAILNTGLDLKTSLSDQVVLVGTLNPDFRNIENQILSLDFSRFERLTPETRPFFLEGHTYLQSAIFTSQRIGNFDAGVNTYGRLSDKVSFGLLDAARFGNQNNVAAALTDWLNPDTRVGLRLTDKSETGHENSAYELVATRQFGPTSVQLFHQGSRDTRDGNGQDNFATVNYQKGSWSLYGDYSSITPKFNPALGFVPENDLKGVDYQAQYSQVVPRGMLGDYNVTFGGTSYKHFDNSSYRREQYTQLGLTLRNGLGIDSGTDFAGFEGSHDKLYGISLTYPRGAVTKNVTVSYNWGQQAGLPYSSRTISGAYKFWRRLQLTVSNQAVLLGHDLDQQTILGINDDLGHNRALSGRAVMHGSKTNLYLALSQQGNLGTEYFLILGDPNATTFRPSLILKVVTPFQIGGGHQKAS